MSGYSTFGHSSTVRLTLQVGNREVSLSRIGPQLIGLTQPQQLPPGPAVVVMEVDGRKQKWEVDLIHGAVPFDEIVEISRLNAVG